MAKEYAQIIKPKGVTDLSPKVDTLAMLGLKLNPEVTALCDSPTNEYLSLNGGKKIEVPVAEVVGADGKKAKASKAASVVALDFGQAAPRFNSLKLEVNGELVARVGAVYIQPELSAERNHSRRLVLGFSRPVTEEELNLPWLVRVRQSSTRARL